MQTLKFKILIFFIALLMLQAFTFCREMIPVPITDNSFSIYKTTNDYFDNMFVTLIEGEVSYIPDLYGLTIKDTTIIDTNRIILINGYILDFRSNVYEGVLSYSFSEYYYLRENYMPSKSELQEQLIDQNPFVEFYGYKNEPLKYSKKDTAILNEIIRNNELDKYFINLLTNEN